MCRRSESPRDQLHGTPVPGGTTLLVVLYIKTISRFLNFGKFYEHRHTLVIMSILNSVAGTLKRWNGPHHGDDHLTVREMRYVKYIIYTFRCEAGRIAPNISIYRIG